MNMALIMTAVKYGATVANYAEVTALHKNAAGKLTGAQITDVQSGESFAVNAKVA
jgi:glycerol-3-phosphate dehydrogenase